MIYAGAYEDVNLPAYSIYMTDPAQQVEVPKLLRLTLMEGALVDVPVWEEHHRGKNWAAVIGGDPRQAGGLSRRFMDYARGDFFYLVGDLALFDAVEFAGDYIPSVGNTRRNRWYGVLITKALNMLEFQKCPRGVDAVLLSSQLRQDPSSHRDALMREFEHCRFRTAQIEEELVRDERKIG